jgi:hypothetical protein
VASAAAPQPAVESAPAVRETPKPAVEPAAAESRTADSPPAQVVGASKANHSGEEADEHAISSKEMADEEGEGIVRKRRGIRLKQDLN